jgi:hypothetical protein
LDLFRGLTDTRKGQGKRHRLATLYTIIACAKLSGIPGGHRAIYLYARSLTKPQRRALHCWVNPRTGEYEVPSETCFFRALKRVTVQQVQAIIDPWLDEKLGPVSPDEPVAIDGKTLNHSGVHLVSGVRVRSPARLHGARSFPAKQPSILGRRKRNSSAAGLFGLGGPLAHP